tara:strand:+ start:289 stop:456 length:168 start_codon:yes stop_codon:yes gene_type:complete
MITQQDLEQIEEILMEVSSYGLRIEVKAYADDYQKDDPDLTRLDAIIMGYNDWIK